MKPLILTSIILCLSSLLSNAQVPQILWWYDVFDSSFGQSAAGDIDKDGKLEVVFGCYRNDSSIYALNAENGTLLWRYNAHVPGAEGCNDVAIAMYDVDQDDTLEVIVPSSCNPKTFCLQGKTGHVKWQTSTGGSDSPPSIADIDNDGKAEILHGGFDGKVMCFNSEDGSVAWTKQVFANSWVQTAPTIVDLDGNSQLDFVVGTWAFSPDTSRIYAYKGNDQTLLWSKPVSDYIYHGTAVADFDNDNKPELVLGDYNGKLYALNGENGSTLWEYQASVYIGAPATIADLNQDGNCDIIFCDAYGVGALSKTGSLMWYYTIPNVATAFRGVALGDINGDNSLDVVFGSSKGRLTVLNGNNGSLIWDLDLAAHIGKTFNLDHAPLIADFNQDGKIDIFIVGGKTEYPNFQNNYGRAYMITAGTGSGPNWLMFQHDLQRKSSMCNAPLSNSFLEKPNNFIKLSPNPCSSFLQIESSLDGIATIKSIFGNKVQSFCLKQGDTKIDISNLVPGFYLFSFNSESVNHALKFIKE